MRRATADHAAALTDLAHRSKDYWGYGPDLIRLWETDLTLQPSYIEANEIQVARRDEEIVGMYALESRGNEVSLEHFWVEPAQMGQGVGRALFVHAVGQARKSGARRMRIESDPNAEPFYAKMGARRVGKAPSTPAGRMLSVLIYDLQE